MVRGPDRRHASGRPGRVVHIVCVKGGRLRPIVETGVALAPPQGPVWFDLPDELAAMDPATEAEIA